MTDPQTKALMEQAARVAAEEAIRQTFVMIGIDQSKPFEVQKDMASLREIRELINDPEFRKDVVHLRKWRKTMDTIESRGVLAAASLLVFGGIAAILVAFRVQIFGS